MNYNEIYNQKKCTVEECVATIRSGDSIIVSGVVAEPTTFLQHVEDFAFNVENVRIHKSKVGDYSYLRNPEMAGHVLTVSHFFDTNLREGYDVGIASYIPSDLHNFMTIRGECARDNIFWAAVSPMDENGNFCVPYCQMFEKEAYENCDRIILEVNSNFRAMNGGVIINVTEADMLYEVSTPVLTTPRSVPGENDLVIGRQVADLIRDGDTLQLGIGALPDTIGNMLKDKNDLGLHTEMFTCTMADLIDLGVITGRRKTLNTNEHIVTFMLGDDNLYRVAAENPQFRMVPASYGNDPYIIAQHDNMVSVNTCIEIDLTGQICSESIGPRQYTGTGGATDYAYGAFHSKGGRGILAFASTTKKGTISKIKPTLSPGSAVSISRNLADIVVTEYGTVRLRGKTVMERAELLISVAHPDFRDELRAEAKRLGYIR